MTARQESRKKDKKKDKNKRRSHSKHNEKSSRKGHDYEILDPLLKPAVKESNGDNSDKMLMVEGVHETGATPAKVDETNEAPYSVPEAEGEYAQLTDVEKTPSSVASEQEPLYMKIRNDFIIEQQGN